MSMKKGMEIELFLVATCTSEGTPEAFRIMRAGDRYEDPNTPFVELTVVDGFGDETSGVLADRLAHELIHEIGNLHRDNAELRKNVDVLRAQIAALKA